MGKMSMRIQLMRAATAALLTLAAGWPAAGSVLAQGASPVILTEGFEGSFQSDPTCKQGTCNVPAGWGVWFIPRDESDLPGVNFQPQADRTTGRAQSGTSSQRLWTDNATFTGGIYRVVNDVQVGARVRFTIWGQVWSTNDDSPISSRPSRDIRVKVGVDPLGGENGRFSPLNGQVIWSPEQEAKDSFVQFSVEVEVRAPTVILYTYTTMRDNVRHNEVFWDDAVLEYVAPPPTATPDPIAAPTVPVTATAAVDAGGAAGGASAGVAVAIPPVTYTVKAGDTPLDIALAHGISLEELLRNNPGIRAEFLQIGQVLIIKPGTTAVPVEVTVAPTTAEQTANPNAADPNAAGTPSVGQVIAATATVGQACVQAFFDADGDGKFGDTEDFVPNVVFVLSAGGTQIGTYTSNGVDEPYCFDNLPNQAYTVAAMISPDYVTTTPLNDTLNVAGTRVTFSLGLRRVSDQFEDVSKTPTPQPAPSVNTNTALGLLSIGGGALLLIGTVGFIVTSVLRRRRL